MTLNDLECPIHLKVRFTDGTLDVRTLWLSDSTICTGITREGGGSGLEGQTLPLHPCGQLTRCFSAVAELLVIIMLMSRNNDDRKIQKIRMDEHSLGNVSMSHRYWSHIVSSSGPYIFMLSVC